MLEGMQLLDRTRFASTYGRGALIGMVHLRPLPGSPLARPLNETIDEACRDAEALARGGAAAVLVENFGDRPFYQQVPSETIAAMTRILAEIRRVTELPLGVNVLRNDPLAALAIAAATGVGFIRVNVLVGAVLTDQGIIQGEAARVQRERARLCPHVNVFADHMVKHAAPLADYDPVQLAKDLRIRGLADGLLVTGRETGHPADPARFQLIREAVPDAPLLAASGVAPGTAASLGGIDGAIVGSSLKQDGVLENRVDPDRVRRIADELRAAC